MRVTRDHSCREWKDEFGDEVTSVCSPGSQVHECLVA